MFRWINDFLRPYQLSDTEYSILDKIEELELRIEKLEEENIETSNCLYELSNSIDAVDARIDILTLEKWNEKDV
jgi:septal ring factor EnvC (AmiA/AmiB activator)